MEGKAWKSFFVALTLVWLGAYAAVAASGSEPPACSTQLKEVLYSAQFDWEGTTPMQIRIGTRSQPQGDIWAVISGPRGCQAICRMKEFVKNSVESPIALSMSCQGAGFGVLTTPATVLWTSYDFPKPTLRFGSWVNGYQSVALRVEFDRYSAPKNSARTVAIAR